MNSFKAQLNRMPEVLGAGTVASVDNSITNLVALMSKSHRGEVLQDKELDSVKLSFDFLSMLSGQVVAEGFIAFVLSERGRRVMTQAIGPSIVVNNVLPAPGRTVQVVQRDVDGEIASIVTESAPS